MDVFAIGCTQVRLGLSEAKDFALNSIVSTMVFRKIILIDSWVGVLYVSKSTVQNEPIRWLYSFRGECICHKGGFYSNELGSCTTNCDEGQVPDKLNNEWRCLKCKNGIVVNHMCTCPSQLAKLNLDGDECVCTDGTESFNGACVRKRLRFFRGAKDDLLYMSQRT